MAVLIPSPLLEFRYYLMPYLLWRIHIKSPGKAQQYLELSLYMIVNAVTIWLFLFKPFRWPQEPGVWQRFMW